MSVRESTLTLPFGIDQEWEISTGASTRCFLDNQINALDDVKAAIQRAYSSPVEFPSLDQIAVPGDRLVFAVEPVIPNMITVVSETLAWFAERGTSPANMSVVVAGGDVHAVENLQVALHRQLDTEVVVELHNPDQEDHLAYLAANTDANPIYMNRTLVDADVVVPITCCRSSTALDRLGAYGIFPLLSDRATRGLFYRLTSLDDPTAHDKLTDWADQAASWAGFLVEIQVIPAGRGQVGEIHAGLTEPLELLCRQRMDDAWRTETRPAELTVALLDGGSAQQNWLGIARALYAATRSTCGHGSIVICTDANASVGPAFAKVRKSQGAAGALTKSLENATSDDAIAAALVNAITDDKHIYLVSKMRPDVVESLGLGVLRSASELDRLIQQFPSTNIVGSIQHRNMVVVE